MDSSRKVTVTVTNRTIVRTILWIAAAVTAYHFIGRVTHILTLIFISFFLALAINPIVAWMSRRLKIESRVRATAASYLLVIAVLAVLIALIVPPLVRQTRDFINTIPTTVHNFQSQDSSLARTVKRYHLDQKLDQSAHDFTSHYGNLGTAVLSTGRAVGEAVASVVAVIVLAFMMLVEGPKWFELLVGALPKREQAHYKRVASRAYKAVSGFVNGQVILALVAAVFAFITLQIAGHIVKANINELALAGIVAVFGIIPLFGNPIAAVLVVLACLLSSVSLAIIMAIYFVIYFFVENHTFQPFLQSKLNELTPLTVFVSALLGVGVAGILGAIVAIPVASTIKILFEEHFKDENRRTPAIEKSGIAQA